MRNYKLYVYFMLGKNYEARGLEVHADQFIRDKAGKSHTDGINLLQISPV